MQIQTTNPDTYAPSGKGIVGVVYPQTRTKTDFYFYFAYAGLVMNPVGWVGVELQLVTEQPPRFDHQAPNLA